MYGFISQARAVPGAAESLCAVLVEAAPGLKGAGCHSYVVGTVGDEVWVSEVWESKEHHDASLGLPEVRDAIARARPMLEEIAVRAETSVRGGLGI